METTRTVIRSTCVFSDNFLTRTLRATQDQFLALSHSGVCHLSCSLSVAARSAVTDKTTGENGSLLFELNLYFHYCANKTKLN